MADRLTDPGAAIAAALTDLPTEKPVGIAVSGGGDSMALLGLAKEHADQSGHALTVTTVDHGLRPESAEEAAMVAQTCAAFGIPHTTLTLTELSGSGNLPARARDARYSALSRWAITKDVSAVLLGHTMDDQAETVLMRLARGSGAEGLSGMPTTMTWDGVTYRRPLLDIRRQALRDWLRNRNFAWIEDPSNEDHSYDRVKARKALGVLEPLGVTIEGLSATADRLSRQRKVLEAAAEELVSTAISIDGNTAILNRQAFRDAIPDTAMRVLAMVLQRIGGNRYRPRFRALEPLYHRVVSDELATQTLAHCLIRLKPDTVSVEPE